MEGGAPTPAGSQSGAGAADTHPEAGAPGQPGENQQVAVLTHRAERGNARLFNFPCCNVSVCPQAPARDLFTAAAALREQGAHPLAAE